MKVIRENQNNEIHKQNDRIIQKSLYWDSTQPMFVYKEEPVLSFIEYMVYLGGLIGLWFGTSANDVITILLDKHFG